MMKPNQAKQLDFHK